MKTDLLKKIITIFVFASFISSASFAQTCAQYAFSTGTTGTLDPMTGSTQLVAANVDDGASAVTNIGFNFTFLGTVYTQFSANSNGLVRLGATAVTTTFTNGTASNVFNPKIMPLWDDHHTGTVAGGGKVHTVLIGTAPNRIRIIEWFVTIPRNITGAANAKFQCWLYETTNAVEFRYGTSGGAFASGTIGLANATAATGDYNIISSTTLHTNSTTAVSNALTTWPGSGRFYRWDPPAGCTGTPNAGTASASASTICNGGSVVLTSSGLSSTAGITLQWQSSPNNSTWTNITGATAASYTATGITSNTYYRIVSTCTNSGLTNSSTSVLVSVVTCQSNNVPLTGNNVVPCGTSTFLYDDGGPSVNYSSNANGYTVLDNSGTGVITLSGTYACETSFDYLRIYSGVGTGGALLGTYNLSAGGSITPLSSPVGTPITVQFTSDGSVTYSGFALQAVYTGTCAGCTGTPNTGTVTSTASGVCSGTPFTLSASGLSTGNGISYQWQSGPSAAGPWSNISGATTSTVSTTLSANTYYQIVTSCSNSGLSASSTPVLVSLNSGSCQCTAYCASNATSTADDEILNVTLGTLNNTSACGALAPGVGSTAFMYSNYTGAVAAPSLLQGSTVNGSVTIGYCSGLAYTTSFAVYIDYNQNGVFTDPGELVYSLTGVTAAVGGTAYPFTITIPPTATTGTTRMRVVDAEISAIPLSCGTNTWGETEDYCVTITAPPPCSGTPSGGTISISSSSGCSASTFTLSATGLTAGSGISYQWQSASSAGGPWSDITGATSSSLSTSVTADTYYQLVTTCSNGGATATSNVVSYLVNTCTGSIVMNDAFGDGWNGATMTLNVNGSAFAVFGPTFTTGTTQTISFCLPQNATYSLVYTNGGSWPGEVGVDLNINGTVVYTVGAGGATAGTTLTTGTACPPACTVTTTPGTLTASLSSTTVNDGVLYTVTGGNGGVTSYQYSFDNFLTVAGSIATSTTPYTIILNVLQSQVSVRAVQQNGACPSATTNVVTTTLTCAPPITTLTSTYGDYVSNVTFNTINNTSTYDASGDMYQDFTSISTSVCQGSTYTLSVTGPPTYSHYKAAWIDWNGDGDFADAGEYLFTSAYATGAATTSVTVPVTSVTGNVKMRVISVDDITTPTTDPCEAAGYDYGEVEEYTITIVGAPAPTVTGMNTCYGGNALITSSASSNWYTVSTGGTAFATAATSYTTPSLTAGVTYYVEGINGSCVSPTRTAVTVTVGSAPTAVAAATSNSTGCNIYSPNAWSYFVNSPGNEIIACVKDITGGNNLGSVSADVTIYPAVQYINANPYMARVVTITPTSNGPADVRLFFTTQEFQALQAAEPLLTSTSQLAVTKYPGPGLTGSATLLTPTLVQTPAQTGMTDVYSIDVTVTGFSTFVIHYNSNNFPLPIELMGFAGECNSDQALLKWSTATEQNNNFFTILKSNNGVDFTSVGTVQGAGNSSTTKHYSWTDPMSGIVPAYYRLKQTDFNGNSKEFNIVYLDCQFSTPDNLTVIPNPSNGNVTLSFESQIGGDGVVTLHNAQGTLVKSETINVTRGANQIPVRLTQNAGIYHVSIQIQGRYYRGVMVVEQ